MAWQTGTSTDWQDLLADLRTLALANGYTSDRYDTSVGGDSNVDEMIIHSTSEDFYIGVRTFYDSSANAYNWELAGFTGYAGGSDWGDQPGISPGRYDGLTATLQYGAYVPLSNGTITYWFSVTSRRIYGVLKIGTSYLSFYMGFLNPFASASEYPYPLYIAGCTAQFDRLPNSTNIGLTGLADPVGMLAVGNNGPAFVRSPGGTWLTVKNSFETSINGRTEINERGVWPCHSPQLTAAYVPDDADRQWITAVSTYDFDQIIPNSANPGTQIAKLYKSDDSGGDLVKRFPCTVWGFNDDPEEQIYGELDGVFWVSAAPGQADGAVTSEDTLTDGADTFHVFAQGNRTQDWNYQAIYQG